MPLSGLATISADALVRNIPSTLLVFDGDGTLVTWNSAAAKALGLQEHANAPVKISDELDKAVASCISRGALARVDECNVEVEGQPRIFGFTANPIVENAQAIGAVVTGRDITERVQVNREIEDLRSRAGIEKVARQVAHELRNPLNAIKTHAQYIELTFPKDDPSRHYSKVITDEVDRIDRLLTGLRDLSRAYDLKLQLRPLGASLNSAIDLTSALADDRGISIVRDIANLPRVLHDRAKLEQVFINLMKNAIEALDYGGTIAIKAHKTQDAKVRVSIMDDGPGIDPAIADKVFNLFYSTKGSAGEGVGLAVSREIVERHGGTLSIETDPDWSTCFSVELGVQ